MDPTLINRPSPYPVYRPDMGRSSGDSSPVYSAQDLLSRQRGAQDWRATQIDKAAQSLYDYYQANPMQWDSSDYTYGGLQTMQPGGFGNGYDILPSSISQTGSIQGGTYTPTMDDARQLVQGYLNYHSPNMGSIATAGPNASQAVAQNFGSLPQGVQDYLASGQIMQQGGDLPDVYMRGGGNAALSNDLSSVGFGRGWLDTLKSAQPTDTAAQISQMQQGNQAANSAYQNETLGGNYAGGVLSDKYTNPFGDVTSTFDPSNPMGVNSSIGTWQTPSYGGPNSGEMALRPTGQYGGLGGLGGMNSQNTTAFGGPWGASNAWSPR
jgi:hypothetical protein